MKGRRLRWLLGLLGVAILVAPALAREFRSLDAIATPAALPAGAEWLAAPRPVPRAEVERAVRAVADAWNGRGLDPLLGRDFASKSRLIDTIAEVVPRDAKLDVLAVQAVSVLSQYRQADRIVSQVSAVVHSQIEFNDPVTGYQRLEGRGEWYFEVSESTAPATDSRVVGAWDKDLVIDDRLGTAQTGDGGLSRKPGLDGPAAAAWPGTEEGPAGSRQPPRREDDGRMSAATPAYSQELPREASSAGASGARPVTPSRAKPGGWVGKTSIPEPGAAVDEAFQTPLQAPSADERPADWPAITTVRPSPLRADEIIQVFGEHFGDVIGSLSIARREGRVGVSANVLSWSDRHVTAVIGSPGPARPGDGSNKPRPTTGVQEAKERLFSGLGSPGPVEAVLWLSAWNDQDGRRVLRTTGHDVVFERYPEVFSVSASGRMDDFAGGAALRRELHLPAAVPAVNPGSTVVVSGVNFLSRPGSASFDIGGQVVGATVVRWSDNEIELVLPETTGGIAMPQTAIVRVSNPAGATASSTGTLYFFPRLVDRWAEYTFELDCRRAIDEGLVRATMGQQLTEGWQIVEDAHLYYDDDVADLLRFDAGCRRLLGRPRPGDDTTRHTVSCRCPPALDATIRGTVFVHLRGPAGTFYHDY